MRCSLGWIGERLRFLFVLPIDAGEPVRVQSHVFIPRRARVTGAVSPPPETGPIALLRCAGATVARVRSTLETTPPSPGATVAAFLATDRAAGITGTMVNVTRARTQVTSRVKLSPGPLMREPPSWGGGFV